MALFDLDIQGLDRLQKHIVDIRSQVSRARHVGVERCGKYLFYTKIQKCQEGLYSGQEVAPNKWRYGWEYLGGPAAYEFTKNLLNSHRLGPLQIGIIDRIEVWLDMNQAPYASFIHGPMEGKTFFYNQRLRMLVETRPWMKVTEDELKMCMFHTISAYRGT